MLYTGPEELDDPVDVVVVGSGLLESNSLIVCVRMESSRLKLVEGCGFVGSLVVGVVVVAADHMARIRLPSLVEIEGMELDCMRGVR